MIQPVVLCGGSGTRLWPVSRKAFPKQFVELVAGKSLLRLTLERLSSLPGPGLDLVCVGAEEHQFLLRDAVAQTVGRATVILEPCPRSTAAAMVLAALQAPDPEQLQLFCPADHHIPDVDAFIGMVRRGARAASDGAIVVFGVVPTCPSSAYGYIERGAPNGTEGHRVARFIEKPDAARALELLRGADVLWNAGIFLCKAGVLLDAVALHAPDIVARCREAMQGAHRRDGFIRPGAALQACRSESIDVAVMERHRGLVVFPFQGAWSDVGSWNALADIRPQDELGNVVEGYGVLAGTARRNYIHAPYRRVVALGTSDLVIVDTPDAVLVADRSAAEVVKALVGELERRGDSEAIQHRKVLRPWGYFDSVERGPGYHVKRLFLNPLGLLSLQLHHHRSEHWVVVHGVAEVTLGTKTFILRENQSVDIPVGTIHRLHNPGATPLEVIEVQSGNYLGEDDIVRFDDAYGRRVTGLATLEGTPGAIRATPPAAVPVGELNGSRHPDLPRVRPVAGS